MKLKNFSSPHYLYNANPEYIESVYQQYLENPNQVEDSWRFFFDGMNYGFSDGVSQTETVWKKHVAENPISIDEFKISNEAKVASLIQAYRQRGIVLANLDPLHPPLSSHPSLDLKQFDLSEENLSDIFTAGNLINLGAVSLREIINHLKNTYCGTVGYEFSHIQDKVSREWLQGYLETIICNKKLDVDTKKYIFSRLSESEGFEQFLHTRFVAQKRFSIQGAESLIPAFDNLIDCLSSLGANQLVVGMAHRGRLNFLRNIFGKESVDMFSEFEQNYEFEDSVNEGDVKYHMGYSTDVKSRSGKSVHLSLANNPSHLEFVSPVVLGMTYAKQIGDEDLAKEKVVPVLFHGDAAFAGQGVVYETLNLSQVEGFSVGGSIHIVINNQVGFTTNPEQARSTTYATDLAKMLEVPIFHVNGDDPEALWNVFATAAAYRQKFKKDVVVDLICYRKYGHNEGDEPSFTQPILYKSIKGHSSPRAVYLQRLIEESVFTEEEAEEIFDGILNRYDLLLEKARREKPKPAHSSFESKWKSYKWNIDLPFKEVGTRFDKSALLKLADSLYSYPKDFKLHPKLKRVLSNQLAVIKEDRNLDWACVETLTYASLLYENNDIRLTGQDVERGTFSHRNALLKDFETGSSYIPLNNLNLNSQGDFEVKNSILSETAVLGFEYGVSLVDPQRLVIWEAQFGDFANGAQVIIDQFLCSGEAKWQRASGLVLFLPHGYEGQGPEHSSGRLERFLQLCGKRNMQVMNFSNPSQVFHGLRRHMIRGYRKPMIVMTPKSLLRHPKAVCTVDDLTSGSFQEIIDDQIISKNKSFKKVKKLLLCSGKIYYELLDAREKLSNPEDIAIIRVEQLYPWPQRTLKKVLESYLHLKDIYWVQEEPMNMGAWSYVFETWCGGYDNFKEHFNDVNIKYIGRSRGAAPAVGSMKHHKIIQSKTIKKAMELKKDD